MDVVENIAYAPKHGERGFGDLYLPAEPNGAAAALVIHGGGWQAMDKHGLAGVAQFMAELGYGAFAINYRLLGQAPWPACGADCLRAARFLHEAGHPAMSGLDSERLVVIGASAGGHLAMMTGLRLPPERIRCIVAIAGPSDLLRRALGRNDPKAFATGFWQRFFGTYERPADSSFEQASPVTFVTAASPPLFCVHSRNDELVPLEHSELMVKAYQRKGARAELLPFDGAGNQHGIWIEGSDPHRLLPELEQGIRTFLASVDR